MYQSGVMSGNIGCPGLYCILFHYFFVDGRSAYLAQNNREAFDLGMPAHSGLNVLRKKPPSPADKAAHTTYLLSPPPPQHVISTGHLHSQLTVCWGFSE